MGMLSVIKNVPKALMKVSGKTLFLLKKTKPEILVAGGIVISTGAFILAICNARKLDEALDETKARVEAIEAKRKDIPDDDKKSIREWEKELNAAKADAAWRVFRLIGVPAVMFVGGVAMTVGGHVILFRRFGELSVSFAALQAKYDRYRQMNIAEHGAECDRRYVYGITDEVKTTATITDDEGKEKKVKCVIPEVDPGKACGMYTFIFSEEFSRKWHRDPIMNISFLKSQEQYWNNYLGTGRVVILKNVLDDLGIELDPDDPANDYTMIAGWRPNGDGDRMIDFGIMSAVNKPTLDLRENYIVLNFNCDGNLYHSNRYTRDGKLINGKENKEWLEKNFRGTRRKGA